MDSVITAAIITSGVLVANTIITIFSATTSKKLQKTVNKHSSELAKKFDASTQIRFIDGEKAVFDALTQLTLSEPIRVRVTRYNPRKIQKQHRYFSSIMSRINGSEFEGENCSRLENYNRLTSINSEENKRSLISQANIFLKEKCDNFVLKVTTNKNNFEVLIFEGSETAVFCFHDLETKNIIHSCIITRDPQVFRKFLDFYEKLWNEDILLEIDFSLGREHVEKMLEILENIDPVTKKYNLSPFDNIIYEANKKIEACKSVENLLK